MFIVVERACMEESGWESVSRIVGYGIVRTIAVRSQLIVKVVLEWGTLNFKHRVVRQGIRSSNYFWFGRSSIVHVEWSLYEKHLRQVSI